MLNWHIRPESTYSTHLWFLCLSVLLKTVAWSLAREDNSRYIPLYTQKKSHSGRVLSWYQWFKVLRDYRGGGKREAPSNFYKIVWCYWGILFSVLKFWVTNLFQLILTCPLQIIPFTLGVANGKSETHRDAETGILKSETETEKFSDLIEKHIYVTDRCKIWDSETHY